MSGERPGVGSQLENLILSFPDLLGRNGEVLRRPTTINELLAVSQFLRSLPDYGVEIKENTMEIRMGENAFTIGCENNGSANTHIFAWGATVEGETPEEDIVEPHLILPPQTDGVVFTVQAPFDPNYPDIAVLGCFDGENGKKIPLAGTETELVAQVIQNGQGKIFMWKDREAHAISISPEISLTEEGQPSYLPPNDLRNLARGGVYLLLVRGRMKREEIPVFPDYDPFSNFDDLLRSASRGGFGLGDLDSGLGGFKGGATRSAGIPPSAAARIEFGRRIGRGRRVEFEFDWSTATPVFLRIRVRRDMPPLQGTEEWVAWINSQMEARRRYSAIVCNFCHSQVGGDIATMHNGILNVNKPCPSCGARSFSIAQYSRTSE